MLWYFGQRQGAQLVVLEGKQRHVWENTCSDSCLDLHLMSSGTMFHAWLLNIRSVVFEGHELPKLLSILTGWGKHSKVVGDGTLKRAIETLLVGMGVPFRVAQSNIGRFTSTGTLVTAWLRELGTLKVLILQDDRTQTELQHWSFILHCKQSLYSILYHYVSNNSLVFFVYVSFSFIQVVLGGFATNIFGPCK